MDGDKGNEFVKVTKLAGNENYISWRRGARTMLEWHDLDAYLDAADPAGNTAHAAARRSAEAARSSGAKPQDETLRAVAVAAAAAAAQAAAADAASHAERTKKSKQAKARLMMTIEPKLYDEIGDHATAFSLWAKCASLYQNDSWMHKARVIGNLATLKLANCASMEEFIREHTAAMCRIQETGFAIADDVICGLIIYGLTPEYESFVGGLDGSTVVNNAEQRLTSEVLKRRLIDSAQAKTMLNGESNTSVAFKVSQHQQATSSKPTSTNKYKKKFTKPKSADVECFKCHEKGHKSFQCSKGKSADDNKPRTSGNAWQAEAFALNAMAATNCDSSVNSWIIDSGATNHLTGDRKHFESFRESSKFPDIVTAGDQRLKVKGSGTVDINANGKIIPVKNVLLVEGASSNLLSVYDIQKTGYSVLFANDHCVVRNKTGDVIVDVAAHNNSWRINNTQSAGMVAHTDEGVELMTWHRRMGHLGYDGLMKLNDLVNGVVIKGDRSVLAKCVPCLLGKQSRQPFQRAEVVIKSKKVLELIHTDVCGPMESDSVGGAKYFVTFIDDHSRKVFVYFIKRKSDVQQVFAEFKSMVENQTGVKIILRSDNGREYMGELTAECKRSGIIQQSSCAYTPQQNGVAERMNRTLVERARCMLFDVGLDKQLWAEAVNRAAYVINRSPNRSLKDQIPEQFWSELPINLSTIRMFGTPVMVHIPKEKRKKFDPKSKQMLFLGFSETQKGLRCFDPESRMVTVSRDVTFLDTPDAKVNDNVLIDLSILTTADEKAEKPVTITAEEPEELNDDVSESELDKSSYFDAGESDDDYVPDETISPQAGPVRRSERKRIVKPYTFSAELVCGEEPATYGEAIEMGDKQRWIAAMNDELKSHADNGTWSLVSLPVGRKTIKTKWVYKLKRSATGEIVRYKARLVAKGCSQRYGLDYEETFSPVVRYESIRFLLAHAAKNGFKVDQMDAVTAFLQGDLDEEIYTDQPEGFDDKSGQVCRLNRAMYGLKQAGRQWNHKLNAALVDIGLVKSKEDPCVYYSVEMGVILAVYVDDVMILWKNESKLRALKSALCTKFMMKDMGRAMNIVGISIEYTKDGIAIHQRRYIESILKRFGMENAKPSVTPSDPAQKLSIKMVDESAGALENVPYQQAVGCLLYLVQATRPDIAFSVNDVSRFNSSHAQPHWTAVKRIMRCAI